MDTPLAQWVSENNPPSDSMWSTGFWDHVEFLYHLQASFPGASLSVVGTFNWETPPPSEKLLFPIMAFRFGRLELVFKNTMFISPYYVVQFVPQAPPLETFDLTQPFIASKMTTADGFPATPVGGVEFSVADDYDLFALLRVLSFGA